MKPIKTVAVFVIVSAVWVVVRGIGMVEDWVMDGLDTEDWDQR